MEKANRVRGGGARPLTVGWDSANGLPQRKIPGGGHRRQPESASGRGVRFWTARVCTQTGATAVRAWL